MVLSFKLLFFIYIIFKVKVFNKLLIWMSYKGKEYLILDFFSFYERLLNL